MKNKIVRMTCTLTTIHRWFDDVEDEWPNWKKNCPDLQFLNIALVKILVRSKQVILFEESLHLTTLLNCLSLLSLWLLTHGFACWRSSQWTTWFVNFYLNLHFQLILGLACWRAFLVNCLLLEFLPWPSLASNL